MTPRLALVALVVALSSAACGGREKSPSAASQSNAANTTPAPRAHGPNVNLDSAGGPAYPGTGFRVHEWGTHTIVVGSDGSMQRGLHHEEEGLPSFVYDRTRKELAYDVAEVKMETPVLYFYSDKPLTALVRVTFPQGVLTQWYPGTTSFFPQVFNVGDPVFDGAFPYANDTCRDRFSFLRDGMLDWSKVDVLGRDATIAPPDAPLDRFTWSHSRAVAANPLRVGNVRHGNAAAPEQEERFLFYRGLGSFPLDLTVTAQPGEAGWDGGLRLENRDATSDVGTVFVLRVGKEKASFTTYEQGVKRGSSLDVAAPAAESAHAEYAQSLAEAMVAALDQRGLYHDESVAMVKTWARQWFITPGVRVLYLAPRAWTESQIPLSVHPEPEEVVRQMVIRVEVITRAEEDTDTKFAATLDQSAALAHFDGLGRFAEPRLRRALAILGTTPEPAARYLERIRTVNATARAGE